MKKLLEAPSRSEMGAHNTQERENILCINVSRYLPKEKEETNYPCKDKEIRPSESKARQGTKKETNPSLLEGCLGRVE